MASGYHAMAVICAAALWLLWLSLIFSLVFFAVAVAAAIRTGQFMRRRVRSHERFDR